MKNPYVISCELDLVSSELVKGDSIEGFRENLDAELSAMGKEVTWVSTQTIRSGLSRGISRTKLPVVSLDDRYIMSAASCYLGISRGVDPLLNDEGYVPRSGYPNVERQLAEVSRLGGEIVLTDDVLFSGEMITWLSRALQDYNVRIGAIVVGVAMREGIVKLELGGIPVESAVIYEAVDDELCERDFAVVPGSGRRVSQLDVNALYFDTEYGRPEKWASLPPDSTAGFMINSIERSMSLLEDVPMQVLGGFYGYGVDGQAQERLAARIRSLT